MSNKTINQALKDLYLGLGGDPSALTDNSTVSDYIEDLESAIKGAASGELPEVTADDIGDVLAVVSDGASGAEWGKGEIPSELPSVTSEDIGDVLTVVSDGESGAEWAKGSISIPEQNVVYFYVTAANSTPNTGSSVTLLDDKKLSDIVDAINEGKYPVIVLGFSDYEYSFKECYMGNFQFAGVTGTGSPVIHFTQLHNDGTNFIAKHIYKSLSDLTVNTLTYKYSTITTT